MRTCFLVVAAPLLLGGCLKAAPPKEQQERATLARRDVVLTVEAEVPAIPPGATELVMWIPVPRDEPAQVLKQMTPDPTSPGVVVVDRTHRNPALRVLFPDPSASASVKVSFLVSRVERRHGEPGGHPIGVESAKPDAAGAGPDGDAAARAAFDQLVATATTSGDCAVTHAPFLRDVGARGIPTRLRTGVSVPRSGPDGRRAGEVSLHCWAEYLSKKNGWVPVDVTKKLFDTLDPDRIGLSLGQGLVFEGQTGPPLDSFALPYAELDGTPIEVITKATWSERR